LRHGEAWPACRTCGTRMTLFLQLDLDALPGVYAGRFGSGLLQQFYCIEEDRHDNPNGWEALVDNAKLTRVIPRDAPGAVADGEPGALAKQIVGWEERRESCHPKEAEAHGVKRQFERTAAGMYRSRFTSEAMDIDTGWLTDNAVIGRVYDQIFNPASGDKLGGWPNWIQGVEYPNCPQCGTRMQFVFQIDSEDHVPFMFGDVGAGHITQCPEHKNVVTFGWACH
jgi:hypothetical protein